MAGRFAWSDGRGLWLTFVWGHGRGLWLTFGWSHGRRQSVAGRSGPDGPEELRQLRAYTA